MKIISFFIYKLKIIFYNTIEQLNDCSSVGDDMEDKIKEIKSKLPSEDIIYDLAELFKVFGDSTRTKILSALEISELCVNDIAQALDMTLSAVSHQLRILKSAKLVKAKKAGKEVIYSLDDDHVSKIFECGISHLREEE